MNNELPIRDRPEFKARQLLKKHGKVQSKKLLKALKLHVQQQGDEYWQQLANELELLIILGER
tara:strand:- start:255 stop:443 length:189 start_codon:yes stop_codon:yes gene_type:complete